MDRGYYHTHALTVAQHPSETIERLMLRLAVFALHASEGLSFTRGLAAIDEPDLCRRVIVVILSYGLIWENLRNDVCAKLAVVPKKSGYILMAAARIFGGRLYKTKLPD